MSEKDIISVGFELPGNLVEEVSFESGRSLMDADIVIFQPKIDLYYSESYLGKPCLSDDRSVSLREDAAHWRREITDALAVGKTVFVIMSPLQEYYIATGHKEFSGTGRNRYASRFVEIWRNYSVLPVDLDVVSSKGTIMKLNPSSEMLKPLWNEFKEHFEYEVYLQSKTIKPLIVTAQGSRMVGGEFKPSSGKGTLILLPSLDFDRAELVETRKDEKGEQTEFWNKTAIALAHKLISCLVEIDKITRRDQSLTPAPEWSHDPSYQLKKEGVLKTELLKIETKISKLELDKEKIKGSLGEEVRLRALLYEKGPALEDAILKALQILGFKAEPYRDSKSEFDVIFESAEGRMLGEAEGKDDKAIDITKLRQLEMNIHEDFERESITSPAKGVLFGNAYRVKEPSLRNEFFTDKCKTAAVRNNTALVRTPDLFAVAKYLSDYPNELFSTECRKALFASNGTIVQFPSIPTLEIEKIVVSSDEKPEITLEDTAEKGSHNKMVEQTAPGNRSS